MPASTGLGVTLAAVIFGGFGSYLTVLVMVVVLPALSFATIVIVFEPADNVTVVLNAPLLPTSLSFLVDKCRTPFLAVPPDIGYALSKYERSNRLC